MEMVNSIGGTYLGAESAPDGRQASTARERYILEYTHDFVVEIAQGGGQQRWKELQIEGAEETAGAEWDRCKTIFDAAFDAERGCFQDRVQAGFEAVCSEDPDVAQYIAEAREAEAAAAYDAYAALNPLVARLAAAEQAEELALSRQHERA